MNNVLKHTMTALGVGLLLVGCNSKSKVSEDNLGSCKGMQIAADHQTVQIEVNCVDFDGIDLYGETGNRAPYIDVQGFQQPLSSILEESITRNEDGVVIGVVDREFMGYFPSNYRTTGKVVMWSLNDSNGEYEMIESPEFIIQTALPPSPATEPTLTLEEQCAALGGVLDGPECYSDTGELLFGAPK